jgi:hypothetical protein
MSQVTGAQDAQVTCVFLDHASQGSLSPALILAVAFALFADALWLFWFFLFYFLFPM